MTLWTGFKQLHSTFDDKIGPNEENDLKLFGKEDTTLLFSTLRIMHSCSPNYIDEE